MRISSIPQIYRHLARWREILAVLSKYELAAWIGRLILPLGVHLFGASVTSLGILLGCLIVLQAVIGSLVLMAGPVDPA